MYPGGSQGPATKRAIDIARTTGSASRRAYLRTSAPGKTRFCTRPLNDIYCSPHTGRSKHLPRSLSGRSTVRLNHRGTVQGLSVTGVNVRSGRLKPLVEERLLSHNLVVGAGTILAGVMGVIFQSLASHQLRPADYGSVFVVITLVTFIGMPAGAFTLLMAREASRDRATGSSDRSATLLRKGNRLLLGAGLAIAGVLAIGSQLLY